jgi:hypothetical protein
VSGSPELDAAGAAFVAILEPVLARIAELERRVDELDVPAWLTLEQAASHLGGTTDSALRKRAQRGQLPGAVRDGARWLVDRRVLDRELASSDAGVKSNRGGHRGNGAAPGTRGRTSHA